MYPYVPSCSAFGAILKRFIFTGGFRSYITEQDLLNQVLTGWEILARFIFKGGNLEQVICKRFIFNGRWDEPPQKK